MAVYIVAFLLSILLFYIADSQQYRGTGSKVCVGCALLIPCLVAGLRDRTIGTDVLVYVEPLFLEARVSDSFLEFYNSFIIKADTWWATTPVNEIEIGFTFLCYVAAKVFNSMPLLLFCIQALTVIPIYKGLRAFSDTQPVWLGMVVYYLMFYNQTLNMMRQWIAMAFLFNGFQFLRSRQYRKYFLFVLVAALFHNSAVLAIGVFFIHQLVARENSLNNKVTAFLLILIGVVMILSLEFFAKLMTTLGLRYGNYITGELMLMPNQILYRLPILFLLVWRWKYLKEHTPYAHFFLVLIIYDLLASQLTSIFPQSARIALFFSEYYLLAYPSICMASASKKNRQAMKLFTIAYLSYYWWYIYVLMNASETMPYLTSLTW